MTRIRKLSVQNFRGIRSLEWLPEEGINCLVGPGDSGKSTVLEAIDLCLGARRAPQIGDADFHLLDCGREIVISATLGALDGNLMALESYGQFLRGFDRTVGLLEDEPGQGLETVITVEMRIGEDLEPQWSLVSDRASRQGLTKNLSWGDRTRIAPTRLAGAGGHNLGWRRGSVLSKVSDEKVDVSSVLSRAARDARTTFGEEAAKDLASALQSVQGLSDRLGVPVGTGVTAMLDPRSMDIRSGTVSLHDSDGVPLQGLGLGSSRLLVVGLQRLVAEQASMILVDELEHGLEPHRIHRLLSELGSKEQVPPLQAFLTTHSPVAVKELTTHQLQVVRRTSSGEVSIVRVSVAGDVQGAVRLAPDALLSRSVLVCEGATEVGFVRGLDRYRTDHGYPSLTAHGVGLVDGGGSNTFARASAFIAMGYRTAVLRDSDRPSGPEEGAFLAQGGEVFAWRAGHAVEDELFLGLGDAAVGALLESAVAMKEADLVDQHIKSTSAGRHGLEHLRTLIAFGGLGLDERGALASAAKKGGWFKQITAMEDAAHDVVGPNLRTADAQLTKVVIDAFKWIDGV
ncbi:ATP-dependent nuclease [Aureimonas pseudogalii]|uniref:Putative ATPase n=2 Tax=Aureimonas pseudogalii TaxID=1744844 RepID=A0A7W6EBQ5_9HYPH|nr:ATP-binding protein [Aureimonas pseudogalii]MBB3998406.1 putative ATPase [Aureimonas pseudogalii]